MSSFVAPQQQHTVAQELSPEAIARKIEKNRLNRLRLKEKKRALKENEANGEPAAVKVEGEGGGGQRGGQKNEGGSSTDMMKNILGIAGLPRSECSKYVLL